MSGKPELLCVGRDTMLNRTRRLILGRCFEVKVAYTQAEAIALLMGQRFDLVLLCYSLSEEECRALIEAVHGQSSPPKILLLAEGDCRPLLGPRDEEFTSGGPADLLRKAAAMAGIASDTAENCVADQEARESYQQPM
jgi:hypothetical protein